MADADDSLTALGNVQRRATLFVRDLEASVAFYADVIGYSVYHRREFVTPVDAPFPVGEAGTLRPGKFVIMKGSHPLMGMIGLLWYEKPLEDHHGERLGYGHAVLVLQCDDIDAMAERLDARGARFAKPLGPGMNTGDAQGNQVQSKSMFVYDPDGYLLEIFQPVS